MNQSCEKEGSAPASKTGYQFMYWTMFHRDCLMSQLLLLYPEIPIIKTLKRNILILY